MEYERMTSCEKEDKTLKESLPTVKEVETELAHLKFRKEHYIPKERIEQRIKEIFPKASAFDEVQVFTESDAWLMVMEELKALLDKNGNVKMEKR